MNAELAKALVAAQAEMPSITKNAKNPHFNSKFASLDAIIEHVRPVLAKHGLGVLQTSDRTDEGRTLIVRTYIVHASGEMEGNAVYVPITKQDAQGVGGALTYGRRYGLSSLLCLATDEDDDGNAASRPAVRKQQPRDVGHAGGDRKDPHGTWAIEAAKPHVAGIIMMDGKPLDQYDTPTLEKMCKRRRGDPKFEKLVNAATDLMNNRALGIAPQIVEPSADEVVAKMKADVEADDASLPF